MHEGSVRNIRNQEFGSEQVPIEILRTSPSGDIKQVARYISLNRRGKGQAGNTSLGGSGACRWCGVQALWDLQGRQDNQRVWGKRRRMQRNGQWGRGCGVLRRSQDGVFRRAAGCEW